MAQQMESEIQRRRMMRQAGHERRGRMVLRMVDTQLRAEGVLEALKALVQVRMTTLPLTSTVRQWHDDYRDLLLAWLAGLLPEVAAEFRYYGPRRARNKADRGIYRAHRDQRLSALYVRSGRALRDMADRRRLEIQDRDGILVVRPQVQSLEEVAEDELERGRKL